MEYERVLATEVVTGDVVLAEAGWCSVDSATGKQPGGSVTLALRSLQTGRRSAWQGAGNVLLMRTDPAAVHEPAEFLGMDTDDARVWAAALGWVCRVHAPGAVITDDTASNRINLWTDTSGTVIRAELF